MCNQSFPLKTTDYRILVIGDVIMDEYVYGHAAKLANEGPVPAMQLYSTWKELGGAANVCVNLTLAGATPILIGVVGTDKVGRWLACEAYTWGLQHYTLVRDPDYRTPWKRRYVCDGQLLLRVDSVPGAFDLREKTRQEFFGAITDALSPRPDCIIISDYGKGVPQSDIASVIPLDLCPVVIDPYPTTPIHGYGAYKTRVFTPNRAEYDHFKPYLSPAFVTDGPNGMDLVENGGVSYHEPARTRRPVMVTGAGDVVTAWVSLGLCAGLRYTEILRLANLAAGRAVRKPGNSTVTKSEVEDAYRQDRGPS